MRIFLDTNILIYGIVFHGNEHELLLKSSKVPFYTSEDAIDELMKTIERKLPDYTGLVAAFLHMMELTRVERNVYKNKLDRHTVVRDKHDRHILAAAAACKSEYLVTGDNDLLFLL